MADMKFLLTTVGTIGDINGFLGIAQTLHKRGHEVVFITNPRYKRIVKDVGVEFVSVGDEDELRKFVDSPEFYDNSKAWKACLRPLFLSPMRRLYEVVVEHYVPKSTVVVGSGWAFGARIASEKLNIPMATIHLETQTVRSLHDTPLMPPPMIVSRWVPRFAKQLQFWIADRWFIDPQLEPETNRFRHELGLAPVKRLLNGWWNSPERVIGMYPKWFYPRQPDWPPQMVQTGFSNWDQSSVTAVPEELSEFIESGEPPVVFFPGSNNVNAHRFFEAAVAACEALDQRGVIITPDEADVPPLPANIRRFAYVPFGYLLPRSRAIVHHGGRGTASPAIAAAIPQVISPMTFGQVDFAYRLTRMGVAEIIKPKAVSAKTFTRTLERMLSSGEVRQRCQELAEKCTDMNSLEQTCDLLEELIGTERN